MAGILEAACVDPPAKRPRGPSNVKQHSREQADDDNGFEPICRLEPQRPSGKDGTLEAGCATRSSEAGTCGFRRGMSRVVAEPCLCTQ